MKEDIAETNKMLLSIIESAPYGIIGLQGDGTVSMCNNLVLEQLGIPFKAKNIIGKELISYTNNISKLHDKLVQCFQKGRKFINYIGVFLVVVLITVVYSNQLSGLTIFLGVAGAGIAFALQEVIASVAGFIAINFSNFYKVGDRVMLGGIKGDVVDIGMLRTSMMQIGDWVNGDLYNGKIVRVANSFVFKEPVFNYSGDFPFLWDEIMIPVKTEGDYKYGQEKFLEILNEVQGDYAKGAQKAWTKMTETMMVENAQVTPMVSLVFDQNWITYTLRYVVDFKKRRGTKHLIYTKVLDTIRQSNGKLAVASAAMEITAFPQQTFNNKE